MKEFALSLGRSRKNVVTVPTRVTTHEEFVGSIRKIRLAAKVEGLRDGRTFVAAIYYFLGWMVGDGVKNPGSRRYLTMRFRLHLTRKHPDNIPLGEYVMDCLRMLGVNCARYKNGRPRRKVPNGYYAWGSSFSSVVGWLFTACLGLKEGQLTTKHPVRMNWLLHASREARIWFLRGLADSDGNVDFHHRTVEIATSPNTAFVRELFESLGIHARGWINREGYGYVRISYADAFAISIFNPSVMTYRRQLLEKLANAIVFRGRWPNWLDSRILDLARKGLSDREISETILDESGVYARIRTIKRKRPP